MTAKTGGEPSADIRTRVAAVRAIQAQRYQGLGFTCNAQLPSGMLRRYCPLAPAAEKLLRGAFERMGYSARAYDRILRVARTIADMNGCGTDRRRRADGSAAIPENGQGGRQMNICQMNK